MSPEHKSHSNQQNILECTVGQEEQLPHLWCVRDKPDYRYLQLRVVLVT